MPCPFEITVESSAGVEQVHAAFGDRGYWLDRLAAFAGGAPLDDLTVGADGAITVLTTHELRHIPLPDPSPPTHLTMAHTETWHPTDGLRMRGTAEFLVPDGYGTCCATTVLTPTQRGSRLTSTVTVEVTLPVIGGFVERYVRGQLAEQLPAVHRFTAAWIAEHRPLSTWVQ
jgi:hypothetical protein